MVEPLVERKVAMTVDTKVDDSVVLLVDKLELTMADNWADNSDLNMVELMVVRLAGLTVAMSVVDLGSSRVLQ